MSKYPALDLMTDEVNDTSDKIKFIVLCNMSVACREAGLFAEARYLNKQASTYLDGRRK